MHFRPSLVARCAVVVVLATLIACADLPTSVPSSSLEPPGIALTTASGVPTGRTVVVFKDTSSVPTAGLALLGSLGATVTTNWDDIGVVIATGVTVDALAAIAASDLVAAVGNDRILNWLPDLRIGDAVSDGPSLASHKNPALARYYADGTQWSMRVIQADKAWAAGFQGTPTTRVAVLDTGIDYGHREIVGLVDMTASASFTGLIVSAEGYGAELPADPQQPGDEPFMDNHFHGTHVASTIASNSISVAPVAPHVTLIAVKVLSSVGSGTFEGVAAGIRHAAGPANADVINMSLGAEIDYNEEGAPALLEMMSRVIKDAEKKGTIVISAAGNSALNLDVGAVVATPCEQSTVCVSATGPLMQRNFDQPATYTNYGITAIEVAAPGGNASDTEEYVNKDLIIGACSRRASSGTLVVCRTSTEGVAYFYAYAAGTSMATPHVAGLAALIKSHDPLISVNGIRSRLLHSADDIGVKGRDVYSNWGRINVAKALGI